jgi:hypothetical protein
MFMHVRSEGRIITHVMELQMHHGNIKRVFLKQVRDTAGINIVLFLGICPEKKRPAILPSFRGMKRARSTTARSLSSDRSIVPS